MNNIVATFDQIITFAKEYNLPVGKKRAILREYLQVKLISLIYSQKCSAEIFFVGGTSLRLLRNLDRFSEDLDFDLGSIPQEKIDHLMEFLVSRLTQEQIHVELYRNQTEKRAYYEMKFPTLLYDLQISTHQDEKLMIKFDFERYWQHKERDIVMLNRYGILSRVVTVSVHQLLTQKFVAYLNRKETQPRDIYDIVWLIGQGARINTDFCVLNNLPANLVQQAQEKYRREEGKINGFMQRLKPFLFDEGRLQYLSFFPDVVEKVSIN